MAKQNRPKKNRPPKDALDQIEVIAGFSSAIIRVRCVGLKGAEERAGTLAELHTWITKRNANGDNAYMMAQETGPLDADAFATDDDVTGARCLYVDGDESTLPDKWHVPPAIALVHPKTGRWWVFWPVSDLPLNRLGELVARLAAKYDGDPKITNPSRIVRLAGYDRWKKGKNFGPYKLHRLSGGATDLWQHEGLPPAATKARNLKGRDKSQPDLPVPGVTVDDPRNVIRFADWCAGKSHDTSSANGRLGAQPCVEGEFGNNRLAATGGVAHDYGLTVDEAFPVALEHFNDRCEPPFEDDEFEKTFTSGYNSADNQLGHDAPFREPIDCRHLFKGHTPSLFDLMQGALGNETGGALPETPLFNIDELAALPLPEWDVSGLIGRAKIGMIVGPWGQYKSFVGLAMSLALSSGIPWPAVHDELCKQYAVPVPRRVLFLAAEGGASEINLRIKAELENRPEIDRKMARKNFVLATASAPLDRTIGQAEIARIIERTTERMGGAPEIIFCDTLAKSMVGDENSNTDMGKVLRVAAAIQRHLNCTFVFVHHTAKDGDKSGRGASALPAGIDFSIHVAANTNTLTATINVEKQKDAPEEKGIILQGKLAGKLLSFSRVPKTASPDKSSDPQAIKDDTAFDYLRAFKGANITRANLATETMVILAPDMRDNDPVAFARSVDAFKKYLCRIQPGCALWECVAEKNAKGQPLTFRNPNNRGQRAAKPNNTGDKVTPITAPTKRRKRKG